MRKYILHQILGEWKSNVWIVTEMLLVSVILWFTIDCLYVALYPTFQPDGFDTSHCYNLTFAEVGKMSPNYDASEPSPQESMLEIHKRLKRMPEIEDVVISDMAIPYSQNSGSSSYFIDTISTRTCAYRLIYTPGFFRTFRIQGANGETPDQLEEIFADKHHVITASGIIDETIYGPTSSLIGKTIGRNQGEDNPLIIGAITINQKRSKYEDAAEYPSFYKPGETELTVYSDVSIRVHPNADKHFKEQFWEIHSDELTVGNCFLMNIESFDEMEKVVNFEQNKSNKLFYIGIIFLLVNIFLGMLGTFWFRCQQRIPQMSLQKAIGFTGWRIFRDQIAEGIILLAIATVPALVIDINLALVPVTKVLRDNTFTPGRFALAAGLAFILMLAVLAIGIAIPTIKAGRIQPSEGLHQE